ncbi:hypothetical protein K7W42_21905 [Deinococcus sp. HMF7604]|uniref:hypothetical protein n=1 Tax=Deinococcus betulae TaxID=2873312 RepID=UPI001CCFC93A|nr:hypothetical protein [Deinococcus betulae]MBZ9753492.1 hypothetical protein [Deinococcus betulae]
MTHQDDRITLIQISRDAQLKFLNFEDVVRLVLILHQEEVILGECKWSGLRRGVRNLEASALGSIATSNGEFFRLVDLFDLIYDENLDTRVGRSTIDMSQDKSVIKITAPFDGTKKTVRLFDTRNFIDDLKILLNM